MTYTESIDATYNKAVTDIADKYNMMMELAEENPKQAEYFTAVASGLFSALKHLGCDCDLSGKLGKAKIVAVQPVVVMD